MMIWLIFARDLPDATALQSYEPPLPTMVRAYDGEPIHSYARERRVQLEFSEFPAMLVRAYLAAEDRTFFEHGGLDYPGIATAIITNISNSGRPIGASTITQQVAKNLLLTNEVSYRRKVREALLAYRIEEVLSKEEILELYLNQIFLGRNAYGVQAAAQAYFGKDVAELALHEMAYLAILPKGPSNYRPEVHEQRAVGRRDWVLGEMRKNDWITDAQYNFAISQPLGAISGGGRRFERVGGYFIEEVRRQLIEQFGENEEAGPYSVYSGGLWVRTSLNPELQELTESALRGGLLRYSSGKAWSGPINTIQMDEQWAQRLASTYIGTDFENWQIAVAIRKTGSGAEIGFSDGTTGRIGGVPNALKAGDIIAVSPLGGDNYRLQNVPKVSGGMVVQNPRNGRIWAMQGGFDDRMSPFNRATQAERQPGSTIKPFVYATALDQGMTPATIIVDSPFCVYPSAALGRKCFQNFGGSRGAGPQTLRWGVEQSRNLMTVRAANDAGMDNVVKTIKTMGIGDYKPYLAFALGAGARFIARGIDIHKDLTNVLKAAHAHKGAAFIEIFQNCIVYNKDVFEEFAAKKTAASTQLLLGNGEPMLFEKGAKGITLNRDTLELEVVDVVDGDWQAAGVIVHDVTNKSVAHMLIDMPFGEFPMAIGVLYDDPRPTFEAAVVEQNAKASEGKKPDLQSLLNKGQTWTVTEDGPEL